MAAKKSRKSKSAPPKEEEVAAAADVPSKKKKKTKTTTAAAVASDDANPSKKKQKKKQKVVEPEPESSDSEDDMKLTLEALDEISDESDEDDYNGEGEEGDEELDEATARLRQMIQDGQFDGLLQQSKKKGKKNDVEEEEEEEDLEEDELDASMNEEHEEEEEEEVDDDDDEEEEQEKEEVKDDNNDSDDESEEEDAETEQSSKQTTQAIALASALEGTDRHLPWPETFTVVPPTPLPFGPVDTEDDVGGKKRKRNEESEEEEEEYVDVHDDLKREVAFYDNAMEAVRIARNHCENAGIPFTRPEDFFAEMIKSDDHMAKIKDRLIFETKKIEAVERRKSNKEQTVMAKERAAHRIAEKSKAKKAHLSAVEDWKKSAEQGRGRLGGRVQDMDADEDQLRGLSGGGGPNKKRMSADKRYGFGGKRGRFKQNDPKDLNDMSGFNPRGSFAGGQKTSNSYGKGKKGGGGGSKRPGKRARDARRK